MLFACITSFSFSEDGDVYVLHDIISDFDDILSKEFKALEKIKSTGPIYMAASGVYFFLREELKCIMPYLNCICSSKHLRQGSFLNVDFKMFLS